MPWALASQGPASCTARPTVRGPTRARPGIARPRGRLRAGLALVALLALALTGCQSLPDDGAGNPPTDDDATPGGAPAAAGAPVLQLSAAAASC